MTNLANIMKAIANVAGIIDDMHPNPFAPQPIYAQYMHQRFLTVVLENVNRRIVAPLEALKTECENSTKPYMLKLAGKTYDGSCRFESEHYTVFLYNCPDWGHVARIYAKALHGEGLDVRLYNSERVINTAKDYNLPNLAECYSLFVQLQPKQD